MPANPNWTRWIFASIADNLKPLAVTNSIPVIVEGMDDETDAFSEATDRIEIRISGPYTKQLHGEYRLYVDVNVLLTSRFDGPSKNRYAILINAGLFHEALNRGFIDRFVEDFSRCNRMLGDYAPGGPIDAPVLLLRALEH